MFWKNKTLKQLTPEEWESLCDGCAKCCLVRLEDPETKEVACTSLCCDLLDTNSCRCQDYKNRFQLVPGCVQLSADNIEEFKWLPKTCSYRLIHEGKDLPSWHPLVTGQHDSTHTYQMSVKDKVKNHSEVPEEEWPNYIIQDYPDLN